MAARFSQTTRSLAQDVSRYASITWTVAGILLGAWLLWFCFGTVTVYEISDKARLEVRQTSHHVAALVAGKVASTSLAIGKDVQAGDILVELDASSDRLRLKEEQARLDAMPGRIASLRREIEVRERARDDDLESASAAAESMKSRLQEADAGVEFAKDNERRLAKLNANGWATTVEATRTATEARKLAASRDALASDLRRLQFEAQSRAHQHDAEIENLRRDAVALEGEMATTQATVGRLTVDIEKRLVRAPISGKVGDAVPLAAGAYVAEGKQLATVVPNGELMVIADFSPSLTLGRVRPGQKARMRLDGFPWAQFGTVSATVNRVASEIRDNLVRVEFTLDAAPPNGILMQHGLPGSIEVSVEEASPGALVLRTAGLLLSRPQNNTVAGLVQ